MAAKKEAKAKKSTKSRFTKRLRTVREGMDASKIWTLEEAVSFIKKNATAKFDETIEIALNLGIDTKQSDQNVRGMIVLPNGTGKNVRVAVFAKGPKAEEAKKAGADVVGDEDLAAMIQKGDMPFERVVATPDMMGVVGKLGQILGPKGLMPNPKLGTVTMDVTAAVKAAKGGSVEFRAQKEGIVHVGVGKASFDEAKLVQNIRALMDAVLKAKPQQMKGNYLKKASLTSTMGPGVKLDLSSLSKAA
jgi:large subunit ribosomal protein L1